MKKLHVTFVLSLFCISFFAQELHDVAVSDFKYEPAQLTINVNDTVRWTNIQGHHNVNGTTGTFGNNPASFGNEVADAGWVYTFVFTMPGTYDYQCDPHAGLGMVGKIIVDDGVTGILAFSSSKNDDKVNIYPNPVKGILNVRIEETFANSGNELFFVLYNLTGQVIKEYRFESTGQMQINTSGMQSGLYLFRVRDNNGISGEGKVVIQ